ncbi:MAG: GNAT family N-acetyltransferase [Bacteroidota bacterium]
MKIALADTEPVIERIIPVMLELRTQYDHSSLKKAILEQRDFGYQLAFAERDQKVLGVAGFVISRKLAWKRHMYIDDLVVTNESRSTGVGAQLLSWLKEYAISEKCEQMHLDSGVQRFAAHKFYLDNGFSIASHHFSLGDL